MTRLLASVAAMAVLSAGCFTPSPPVRNFADLPEQGTLEIHFVSDGCFHHEDRQISIKKAPTVVAEISPPGMASNGPGGQVLLSQEDMIRLERVLAFWRSGPVAGCTTRDKIELVWRTPSGELGREYFVDASCQTFDSDAYLNLWLLVRRTLKEDPNKPLQPTRAVEPFGMQEPSRCGPRG